MRLVFLAAPFLAGAYALVTPEENGSKPAPQLAGSSESLEFPQVQAESGISRSSLKLTLIGENQKATVTGVKFLGPGARHFSVQAFPGLVLADHWSELQVGFNPVNSSGPTEATMVISTDNPDTPPLRVLLSAPSATRM